MIEILMNGKRQLSEDDFLILKDNEKLLFERITQIKVLSL